MKKYFKNVFQVSPNQWSIILFIIFVVWQLFGVFPLISYEGDAVSIVRGCEYAYNNGPGSMGEEGYGYWMQPLTYWVVLLIKYILPSVSCQTIYCFLSALAAFSFQAVIVVFIKRLLSESDFKWILLAMILVPETYALSMYPNSTVFCGTLFFAGLYQLDRGKLKSALILFVAAPLFRLDVLMVYPLIPVVVYFNEKNLGRTIIITLIYASAVAVVAFAGYYLMKADWTFTFSEYVRWIHIVSFKRNIIAIFGFYGLISPIVLIIGLFVGEHRKNVRLLTLFVMTFFLVHGFNFRFGNSSKHYALLLPFVVALVAGGLSALYKKKISAAITSIVIVLLMVVGVRFSGHLNSFPQTMLNDYVPTLAQCEVKAGIHSLDLTVGGGQPFCTADEVGLVTGSAFYPFFVHNLKEENVERIENFERFVKNRGGKGTFVYSAWENDAYILLLEETDKIIADRAYQDPEFENVNTEEELERFIDEKCKKHVGKQYHSDCLPLYYISLTPICHRWDRMLEVLKEKGKVNPIESGRTIYLVND